MFGFCILALGIGVYDLGLGLGFRLGLKIGFRVFEGFKFCG